MSDSRDPLLQAITQRLDARAEQLDGDIGARLTDARRRALDAIPQPQPARRGWRLPAGAAAFASLAIVAVILLSGAPPGVTPVSDVDALELLTDGNGLDFYSDLDFYEWLPEDEVAT